MSTEVDLQQALNHHRDQRFAEAEQLYRAILLADPAHPEANHNLGILSVQLNQPAHGLPYFKAAVDASPERDDFWSTYIEALTLCGQSGEAQAVQQQAIARGLALEIVAGDAAATPTLAASHPVPEPAPELAPEPTLEAQRAALRREFTDTIDTLLSRGMLDSAEDLARQMVTLLPDDAFGWRTLAHACLRRGDLAGALEPLRKAAPLLPEDVDMQRHLYAATAMQQALALDQQRRYREAGALYQQVLTVYPDHPDANHKLGVVAIRLDQPETAIALLEKALGANPNNGQYWANYVDALIHAGQMQAAWVALGMGQQRGLQGPVVEQLISMMSAMSSQGVHVVRRSPQPADANPAAALEQTAQHLATTPRDAAQSGEPDARQIEAVAAHYNAGRDDDAIAAARKLTERFPAHGFGWKVLSASMHRLGRYDEALEYGNAALGQWPDDLDLLQVTGSILESKGKHPEAETRIRRLLELQPDHAEGNRILGIVLMSTHRLDESEAACRKAVELAPQLGVPRSTLGVLHMKQGRLDEATRRFRESLERDPDHYLPYNNLAFCLTHSEHARPDEIFAAHRHFSEHFETPLKAHWPQHDNDRNPDRTLRIGFISGDFCHHAVANFLEPMLPPLSKDPTLTLYAYSNTPMTDGVTERLRGHFAHWRHIVGAKDEAVAQLVRDDRIDVLIDLSGHSAENRLLTMARKPAPVQVSWIGYPGTTGLDAVDYFVADRFWLPPGPMHKQFSEHIAYIPAVAPFLPDLLSPPVNLLPAQHSGYITFGSFNRMDKLRRDVIATWAELLRALPTARLALGAMPRDGSTGEIAGWFNEEGIARERLDFRPRANVAVYLQQHHHVDVCLDSFPFSGLTTLLHSLWMGVPTVTLPGDTVPGRSGLTAMSHVGLADAFVAHDRDDYLRKAIALASDIPALAELRAGMRARCEASPMFRPDVIADGMSRALRVMWKRWCEGKAPASFDLSDAETN